MTRTLALLLGLLPLAAAAAPAFDYWLLALSWSPQYCAQEARPGDPQCTERRYGFVVHGLWPQYEKGYPSHCAAGERLPAALIERMLPLMPSEKLIRHQWNKHGVCAGSSPEAYFGTVERAFAHLRIPAAYTGLTGVLASTVTEVERRFMADNPALRPESIAVQCSGPWLREVRVCLDTALAPRTCGREVRDRCGTQLKLRPQK